MEGNCRVIEIDTPQKPLSTSASRWLQTVVFSGCQFLIYTLPNRHYLYDNPCWQGNIPSVKPKDNVLSISISISEVALFFDFKEKFSGIRWNNPNFILNKDGVYNLINLETSRINHCLQKKLYTKSILNLEIHNQKNLIDQKYG